MKSEYQKIKEIKSGETAIFLSPIDQNLVRTGTLKNHSSFFHSLLWTYSGKYRQMNNGDKKEYVVKLLTRLKDNLTEDEWIMHGEKKIIMLSLQSKIKQYIIEIYKYIQNPSKYIGVSNTIKSIINKFFKENNIKQYKLIIQILSLDILEKYALKLAFNKCEDYTDNDYDDYNYHYYKDGGSAELKWLNMFKDIILNSLSESFKQHLSELDEDVDDIMEIYLKKFTNLVDYIIEQSVMTIFLKFKEKILDNTTWIDQYLISYFSKLFKRDIYFIDNISRLPIKKGPCDYSKQKSIILLCFEDSFEILGILDKNTKQVSREFKFDSTIITKIYNFLYNRDYIKHILPELIEHTNIKGDDSDDSDIENIGFEDSDEEAEGECASECEDDDEGDDECDGLDEGVDEGVGVDEGHDEEDGEENIVDYDDKLDTEY